ncbi:MAG: hypothetical protein KKA07_12700 [Bacteroidetes bacterium]|nr:hypothetical protein [Bacteroidota bacterium]MBU1719917.1 hypothetical protein [Bacteroidota bacterium]
MSEKRRLQHEETDWFKTDTGYNPASEFGRIIILGYIYTVQETYKILK